MDARGAGHFWFPQELHSQQPLLTLFQSVEVDCFAYQLFLKGFWLCCLPTKFGQYLIETGIAIHVRQWVLFPYKNRWWDIIPCCVGQSTCPRKWETPTLLSRWGILRWLCNEQVPPYVLWPMSCLSYWLLCSKIYLVLRWGQPSDSTLTDAAHGMGRGYSSLSQQASCWCRLLVLSRLQPLLGPIFPCIFAFSWQPPPSPSCPNCDSYECWAHAVLLGP